MKRRTLFAALATVAALAVTGCATSTATPTPTSARVTLGMSYIPDIQFAPAYVAADKGLFSGVNVNLRHHGASEGLFTALAAGEENLVIAGADEMMQARAQGVDLVAVSAYYRTYPVVIIVPADSPIRTLADLKGHSIGLPGRFGESWYGLQVALKNAGLADTDVTIIEVGYTHQAALATKKVDAIVGFANNDVVSLQRSGVAVRSLPIGSGTVPLVSISVITTRAYAEAHPAEVKAVTNGLLAAWEVIAKDPAAALDAAATRVPGLSQATARDAARATLEATLPISVVAGGTASGKFDAQQWTAMADFMLSTGLVKASVDPAKAMTNDLVGR